MGNYAFRYILTMVRSHITHNTYTCVHFSLELNGDWKQGYNNDIIIEAHLLRWGVGLSKLWFLSYQERMSHRR